LTIITKVNVAHFGTVYRSEHEQVGMYYRSGTAGCQQMQCVIFICQAASACTKWHCSNCLQEKTSWLLSSKYDVVFEIRLNRCMFTRETITPNFIPIQFESMEP